MGINRDDLDRENTERENLLKKNVELSSKHKIILISVIAVIVIGIVLTLVYFVVNFNSKTLNITKTSGTITLLSGGSKHKIYDSTKFNSGESLTTDTKSQATIELDNNKTAVLRENSSATFIKKDGKYEITLNEGSVFFDVKKKLDKDEKFEIKTSKMTVSIKGTVGSVFIDEAGNANVVVLEGEVYAVATNPVTGEYKEADLAARRNAKVIIHTDRDSDTVEFDVGKYTADDLEPYLLVLLKNDPKLLERVCKATGWSDAHIVELGNKYDGKGGSAGPTPTRKPTNTPVPKATATPADTKETTEATSETTEATTETTAEATPTPTPSPTPKPTSTPTPEPTATPVPTKKPSKKATATPKPKPQETQATRTETTTQAPVETTPAPVETTPAPVETTPAPVATTPAPVETTPAPTTPAPTTPTTTETTKRPTYVIPTLPSVEDTQPEPSSTTPAPTQPSDNTEPATPDTQSTPDDNTEGTITLTE